MNVLTNTWACKKGVWYTMSLANQVSGANAKFTEQWIGGWLACVVESPCSAAEGL